MDFYHGKLALIELASQLFTYTPKKLTKNADASKFDYIKYDVYGAASFSPAEQMEKRNLNYNRDEQGRDYFNSFLTVAIQFGVKLGFEQKEKEISELQRNLEQEKGLCKSYSEELFRVSNELKINRMPSGSLEDEIRALRQEILDVKNQNSELNDYKRIVLTMQQSLKFIQKE